MRSLAALCLFAVAAWSCGSPDEENANTRYYSQPQAACGNDRRESPEVCDGPDTGAVTCEKLGLGAGELRCRPNCYEFDKSGCGAPDSCGNDERDGAESCDGTDLGGATCATLGLGSGTLSCAANCAEIITSGCNGGGYCGDYIKNGTEACDFEDFGTTSCESLGLGSGSLMCSDSCTLITDFCGGDCPTEPVDAVTLATLCDGRQCGDDPACGISCGSCGPASHCTNEGTCESDICVPECGTRVCGLDPLCGVSCGTCTAGSCNTRGQCEVPADADGLKVELSWSNTTVHPDIALIKDHDDFCSEPMCDWKNCTQYATAYPDWDQSGSVSNGDPRLVGYDSQLFSASPAKAVLPAPLDGAYGVGVHYWSQNTSDPALPVTVKVYLFGQLESQYQRTLTPNAIWYVTKAYFSGGNASLQTVDTYTESFSCDSAPVACSSDADCPNEPWPDTQYCALTGPSSQCASGCRDDSSCPEGQVCNSSRQCQSGTVAAWGEACGNGVDCAAGLFCSWFSNTCVEWCYAPGTECSGTDLTCCAVTGAHYCKVDELAGWLDSPVGYCSAEP